MNYEQFAFWLQGYAEIAATRTAPTAEEWQVIKDHLALLFNKVTPNYNINPNKPPTTVYPPDWTKGICGDGLSGVGGVAFCATSPASLCATASPALTASAVIPSLK